MDVISNLQCRFIPVHHGHLTVHQDELVIAALIAVKSYVLLYFFKGLLSVHRVLAKLGLYLKMALKESLQCCNVEELIVNDQNLLFWAGHEVRVHFFHRWFEI